MSDIQIMLALAALQTIAAQDSKLARATALKALGNIAAIEQREHAATAARKALGVLARSQQVCAALIQEVSPL